MAILHRFFPQRRPGNDLAWYVIASLGTLAVATASRADWDTRGYLGVQWQAFPEDTAYPEPHDSNFSVFGEMQLSRDVGEDGNFAITPFARIDQHDRERSHFDLRELLYTHTAEEWYARIGIGKVFWGVTESSNPVDVINQSDAVENGDASAKLGQPLVNLLLIRDWGEIDLYLLPGFRERTFVGENGRPRLPLVIDTDAARYESSAEERHVDVAARVSTTVGEWDIGLHAFRGTSRDPLLELGADSRSFVPFYYQQTQLGMDVQGTFDNWLLKTELVYRAGNAIEDHAALVTGFERSFYALQSSAIDLGFVAEWLHDERGDGATQPFENDVLLGLRIVANDERSHEALLSVIADLDGEGELLRLEGSRRLGRSAKVDLLATVFTNVDDGAAPPGLVDDDTIQIDITFFF